jgi:transposase
VPAIWLPDPELRAERERARFRLHLVRHRSSLKQRVHAVLLAHGRPCPLSDLFGLSGRALLERLALPEPWQGTVEASLRLIDELDREVQACERELRRLGAEHRYVALLQSVPGIAWVLAYTIAAEIGDIGRFASAAKLVGYSGLCPRRTRSVAGLEAPVASHGCFSSSRFAASSAGLSSGLRTSRITSAPTTAPGKRVPPGILSRAEPCRRLCESATC